MVHVKWKVCLRFKLLKTFLRQCIKAIHGGTHHNEIKKLCWRQLPISKSLPRKGHRDNDCSSFIFVYQKECFQYKTEKVNITIEFCIIELVYVPNFTFNWHFWFFGPNLLKKDVFHIKQKKWTQPLNSAYWNWSRYQISA